MAMPNRWPPCAQWADKACCLSVVPHLAHKGGDVGDVHAQLQAPVRQPRRRQRVVHVRAACETEDKAMLESERVGSLVVDLNRAGDHERRDHNYNYNSKSTQ